jgi:ABC-type glutathione transport system ATPase component
VLFVEHDMDMVRDISDWVIVMAQGKVIAEGPPDSVMGDQRVIDAYLGSHHDQDLDPETEERILAEAQAELGDETAHTPAGTATGSTSTVGTPTASTGATSTGATSTEGEHRG